MDREKEERKDGEREMGEQKEGRNKGAAERRGQEIWWGRGENRQPKFLHTIFKLFKWTSCGIIWHVTTGWVEQ